MEKFNFILIIAILTLLLLLNLIFSFFTWWNSRDQKAVRLAKKLIKYGGKSITDGDITITVGESCNNHKSTQNYKKEMDASKKK
ncbi:hypothetical protein NWP08_07510 [Lactococcus petauri]|uniref:hypothetical protein n=1 Tax=Lactococcus petauri TaxID=1940789 RepID=UPI00215B155F|nr:hypothetical protein [Lactococcus petauri]MCR8688777.1 hypothetical protein [Lactococcus petauri]